MGDVPSAHNYRPAGGLKDPKVPIHWNRFYDYAETTELLRKLNKAFPKHSKLKSLGKSHGNREMWVMTITDFADENAHEKPGFWIDGGIHANELQSVEVVVYTAWYLLEMREHNPNINRMLKERVFYLCPMMSPDSRDAHFREVNSTHTPRTGQRPVDDDRDGLVDEDGFDDLNDDGHVTHMRVRNPQGKWKPHSKYPELLVRVEAGEKGEYDMLGIEGFDNNGDGKVNEDGDGSYDPNRNWPWGWQPEYVQRGAHRYPLSINENRMAADFIIAHPNIGGGQSYHNTGGMMIYGPATKSDKIEASDQRVFEHLTAHGERIMPGYREVRLAHDLYNGHGVEFDWLYQMRGIYAFTNELFTPFNFFREDREDAIYSNEETRREFDKHLLFGDGIVPWTEVDHPQYGKIEVGGLKKNWVRQPPSFLLEEECHRNMAFTLFHADQMALATVEAVSIKPLGDDLTEVTVKVVNERLLPTRSAIDVKRKISPPDLVSIHGDSIKRVVTGFISSDRFFQQPKEQKSQPDRLRIETVPGHSAVYARWLVIGKGPFTVRLRSFKGGRGEVEVQ